MQIWFIAHLDGWMGAEVILLMLGYEGVQWLISQFERSVTNLEDATRLRSLFWAMAIPLSSKADAWFASNWIDISKAVGWRE